MRIALLSDIHANLVALNTVLDDLDRERIDQLVFLGDAAVFGPQPREVLAVLRNLNCLSIMGNTDDWLLNQTPGNSTDEDSRHLADIYFWCAEQLSSADFEFVRTFKPTAEIVLSDNTTLLCFHGSPSSCRQAILPTTPDEEFQSMLSGQIATVMVGGHTHVQIFR
ncbi:MAG TPA: metallophosphoesterase family protein, partial [Anaerolineae bacterium]|nr:metallophosphoesterase family protein [Anaerolineae bacterium]